MPPEDPFQLPRPTSADMLTLDLIVKRVREAAKTRHDFQNAASLAAGERRLRPPPVWESELAKKIPPPPPLDILARAHKDLKENAKSLVKGIQDPPLQDLLKERLGILFPDIGFSPKYGPVRVLAGSSSVLDKIPPHDFNKLILLLQTQKPVLIDEDTMSNPLNRYYW